MPGPLQRAPAVSPSGPASRALDGWVDSLVQALENSRDGLSDDAVSPGRGEAFFRARYEPERDRLADVLRRDRLLGDEARADLFERVDRHVNAVLLPAYARLACRYTQGERNDFYDSAPRFHPLERVGYALAGALAGAFVVWAPFIPLQEKEWILPFFVVGLLYPELRRAWRVRRYQRELNRLVARTDAEIERIDARMPQHPDPEGPERTKLAGDDGEGSETWSRSQGSRRQPGS